MLAPPHPLPATQKPSESNFLSPSFQDNRRNLAPRHQKKAEARSITLAPVADLDEAAAILETSGVIVPRHARAHRSLGKSWPWPAVAIGIIVTAVYLASAVPLGRRWLEWGRFDLAQRHLMIAHSLLRWKDNLEEALHATSDPMDIKVVFRYLGQDGTEESVVFTERVKRGIAVQGQKWSLRITASRPSFVYIFLKDAMGEIRPLVPSEEWPGGHLVRT